MKVNEGEGIGVLQGVTLVREVGGDVVEVRYCDRPYWLCRRCSRFGEIGWTHLCNGNYSNWYVSPSELDKARDYPVPDPSSVTS